MAASQARALGTSPRPSRVQHWGPYQCLQGDPQLPHSEATSISCSPGSWPGLFLLPAPTEPHRLLHGISCCSHMGLWELGAQGCVPPKQ